MSWRTLRIIYPVAAALRINARRKASKAKRRDNEK